MTGPDRSLIDIAMVTLAVGCVDPCPDSPVTVVVKLVIAGEGYEDTETRSEGVEDLGGCIDPDLGQKAQRDSFGYTK